LFQIAWSQPGVRAAWNSPILVKGYDPENGKPLWRTPGIQDYFCPSVIAHDGIVYAIGARAGMGVAVKAAAQPLVRTRRRAKSSTNSGSSRGPTRSMHRR
jgi:hypothetical protein